MTSIWSNCSVQRIFLVLITIGIFSITICLIAFKLAETDKKDMGSQQPPQMSASQQLNQPSQAPNESSSKQQDAGTAIKDLLDKPQLNVVLHSNTNDYDCQGTSGKKTFPNLGYAFMGYNILKGFPLAVGPDPGFTYRIFRPDYSNGGQTADCRYSVPKGLDITRDVSCVTSFSSQIVQTQYELLKALSASTTYVGEGWGFSFSASAGYKQASSTVSDAKVVVIYSKANCNYYISKLEKTQPPPFDPEFLKWVIKLNKTLYNESEQEKIIYLNFFEYYGTHFLHTVTFGASFVHEYKMSASNYTSMRELGVDIAATASFSSTLISVQGGFNLVESKKSIANQFLSTVQERTITKGAPPPADGEARTWASVVQETPIPTTYVLGSLEDLFTQEYMESLGVSYDEIKHKITAYKGDYCHFLRDKGILDNCLDFVDVIVLERTQIVGDVKIKTLGRADCYNSCQEEKACVAIDFCNDCTRSDLNYNKCQMYYENKFMEAESHTAMETTIWISKIKSQLVLYNTAVVGLERLSSESGYSESVQDCLQRCLEDEYCMTFTYCNCSEKIRNCKLYAQDGIIRLITEDGSQTHFLSNIINSIYDIFTTPQPNNITGKM
ncbi:hypothetical protein CHS0354_032141 [Potamilus streckersoni]|uniref:MACPF domain-containing protein n=1 Tax=Potamilus streckersoni TaxID=2493646 RepID=A0AAE0TGQ0_9BIVA|nr:hypothetical protein CHS0354_032141 [Potamilus streckersoni]